MTEPKLELTEKELLDLAKYFNLELESVDLYALAGIMKKSFDLENLPLYQRVRDELIADPGIVAADEGAEDDLARDLVSRINRLIILPEFDKLADPFVLRLEYENKKEGKFLDYVKNILVSIIPKQVEDVKKEMAEKEQKYQNEKLTGLSLHLINSLQGGNKKTINKLKKRAEKIKTEQEFEEFRRTLQTHFTSKVKSAYTSLLREEKKIEEKLLKQDVKKVLGIDYYTGIAEGVRRELINKGAIHPGTALDVIETKKEMEDYLYYLTTLIPAQQPVTRFLPQGWQEFLPAVKVNKEITVKEVRKKVEAEMQALVKAHIGVKKTNLRERFKDQYFLQGCDLGGGLIDADQIAKLSMEKFFLQAQTGYDVAKKFEINDLNKKITNFLQIIPEDKLNKENIENFVQKELGIVWQETVPVIATAAVLQYFVDELIRKNIITKAKGDKYTLNKSLIQELIKKEMIAREKEFFITLKKARVDTDKLADTEYVYVPNPKGKLRAKLLDPYKFCQEYLVDLVKKADEHAKNDRQKDAVSIANEIILSKRMPDERNFRKVLAKENKNYFENLMKFLKAGNGFKLEETTDSRNFNTFDTKDARMKINNQQEIVLPKTVSIYTAYRDVIASEMLGILQALGKTHPELYENFFTFWDRYDPTLYDLNLIKEKGDLKKEYHFQLSRDVDLLDKTRIISGSCLSREQLKGFAEDSGTLKMVISHDGVPSGYIRYFIMETKKGEPALALDTLEVGHPGMIGKDVLKPFPALIDSVRAMGLASIQLMMDANIKYLLGKDGRINHGLKQAFRDKQMKFKGMRKLGKPHPSTYGTYTMHYNLETGIYDGDANVLFYNWRYSQ